MSINGFTLFSSCSHNKNMSSVYLHHKYSLYSDSIYTSSFSSAIDKMLYRGANLVPVAVSRFYLSVFLQNVNMLFFNTTLAKSVIVSVEEYFSFWLWSRFLFFFFSIIITMYIDLLVTRMLKIKVNKTRQHRTQNLQKTYTAYCKFCT